jgi:hypothetical protein
MTDCIPCRNKPPRHHPRVTPTGLMTGSACGIPGTAGDCNLNSDGTPVVTPTPTPGACIQTPQGLICPDSELCSPWQLTTNDDTCEVSTYVTEQLNIAGADLNVYKLLGVYAQGKLCDLSGNGNPISNGYMPNFPAANAFDKYISEWRSAQVGTQVTASAYIGYDFGPIKLNNGRETYGIETAVKHDVAMIKIKQGCDSQNRVTKLRVERSNDGIKWYGVAVLDTPDCDGLVTLPFKRTVPSRYWRLRPVAFNGGAQDYWTVQAIQLIDYETTTVTNIQDRILLENRDRNYATDPIAMKCYYNPIDVQAFMSKFGPYQGADVYNIQVSFSQTIAVMNRPFVVGDIIEIPSLIQYDTNMTPIKKYLEITDVNWAVNGYTASWVPTLYRLLAVPAMASEETQDIFGKLTEHLDDTGLSDNNDGNATMYQDISNISKTAKALANDAVPERGQNDANIAVIPDKDIKSVLSQTQSGNQLNIGKLNVARNPYSKDGLPPNGLPFTEGDDFPANPKNGDYHRMTYKLVNGKINENIAPRLYRYYERKKYWVYIQTDERYRARKTQPKLQEFIDPINNPINPAKEPEIPK